MVNTFEKIIVNNHNNLRRKDIKHGGQLYSLYDLLGALLFVTSIVLLFTSGWRMSLLLLVLSLGIFGSNKIEFVKKIKR